MRDQSNGIQSSEGLLFTFAGNIGAAEAVVFCAVLLAGLTAALIALFLQSRKARNSAAAAQACSQAHQNVLQTVEMAEDLAGLGFWQLNPATSEQQWSSGMRAMFGVGHDEHFSKGDAETILFASNVDLVGNARLHLDDEEPYELRFELTNKDGAKRTLLVEARNVRNPESEVARVIAVVRDATDQIAQRRELELSRERAESEAEEARQMASTDALTGLANRRHVMSELDRMLMKTRRSCDQLALILFDLDHFKSINDTYGHPEGDKVLRKVAEIAQAQARDTDLVGRVGGEEFVWIVPGVDEEVAHCLAERLRKAIAQHGQFGAIPSVTTSIGCAEMHSGDSSLSLFARADGALYEAKNSGRNQVRMAA